MQIETREGTKFGTFLRPKDLDCLSLIPALAKAGVAAVKIEGRFKSPTYIKRVTRAARYVLDALAEGRDPTLPRHMER